MREKIMIMIVSMAAIFSLQFIAPQVAHAAGCGGAIMGIVPWYDGLVEGADCKVAYPKQSDKNGMRNFVVRIILNITRAALTIAAYVAVIFIIKGGFDYMLSTGTGEGMAKAKKEITNAVIGLVVAGLAVAIVTAIAGVVK